MVCDRLIADAATYSSEGSCHVSAFGNCMPSIVGDIREISAKFARDKFAYKFFTLPDYPCRTLAQLLSLSNESFVQITVQAMGVAFAIGDS